MKHSIKFLFLLAVILLPAIASAYAYDFEVDGIYYGYFGGNQVYVRDADDELDTPDYSGSVTIPETVTYNGTTYSVTYIERAFYACSELTSVNIPNSVTKIGQDAFMGCSSLTSIDIPNSVTSIDNYAFAYCSGLTSINIPNSVTSISYRAFYHCSGLTSIVVDSNNTVYDSREDCNAIIITSDNSLKAGCKTTIIPNSVTKIGYAAFDGCSSLTSITIPNSVTSIGEAAFYDCSGLTSVTIPNSVTSIGQDAFRGCSSLNDVYSFIDDPTTVSMGSSVFYRSPNNYAERTLHVPVGTVSAYQAVTKWSSFFGSIVEMKDNFIATSIELNETSAELTEGETLQLTATVLPEEATDKTVTWTSCDEAVATVDSTGLVTAIAPGETTITATTNDGSDLSASCVVTVTSPVIPVGENVLQMADTTVMHGDIISLPVAMINEGTIMAFQTDIFLPEGFTIVTDEDDEYVITSSERLTSDHIIMSDNANNGAVRVICYTPNSQAISGNEGDLFYIHIQVPDDAEGDYTINVRNTLLTTASYNEVSIPDVSATITVNTYIPGDVNDSRTVNVTDIVVAAMFVLDQNPSPFIFEAADMNDDGNVTVTDIMLIAYLINHPTMNAPKRMPALMDCNDRMSAEGVTLMPGETRTVSIALDNEMDYSAFQLDLRLPDGLTASNFQLTDRAGSHAFDVSMLASGDIRALCYSPAIQAIEGHEGALLTFDVTATGVVEGDITVDGIELVTADCQTVLLNGFAIGVNTATSVNEVASGKTVARVDYFNLAGQRIARPEGGVTLVVTTYTDGTRTTEKVIQ